MIGGTLNSRLQLALLALPLLALALLSSYFCAALPLPQLTGGLAALVLFVLMVRRPVLGVALVCALLPLEGIAFGMLAMTEVRLAAILAFAAWVLHLLVYGKPLRINLTLRLAGLLVLWAGISLLWVQQPLPTAAYLTLLQLLLLALLVINAIEDERDYRLVCWALVLGAVASAPLAIGTIVANALERARVYEAQNANAFAVTVALAMIAGLYLCTRRDSRWSTRALAFLLTCGLAVPQIMAQSRSTWIGLAAAIGYYIYRTERRWRNLMAVGLTGCAAVAVIFASGMVSMTLVDRAMGLVSLRDRGSDRFDIWMVAVDVIRERPLLGAGFTQFHEVYNRHRARTPAIRRDLAPNRDAHNLFISITAELGLVGLALLVATLLAAWREEHLPARASPWVSGSLLAFLVFFSLGGTSYLTKMFWIILALAVKARTLAAREDR